MRLMMEQRSSGSAPEFREQARQRAFLRLPSPGKPKQSIVCDSLPSVSLQLHPSFLQMHMVYRMAFDPAFCKEIGAEAREAVTDVSGFFFFV